MYMRMCACYFTFTSTFVCTANGESMELRSVTHMILYLVKTFRFNIFMCIGVMINCKNWFVTRMTRGCNWGGGE